jgi:alanyl-tRNA synthetase
MKNHQYIIADHTRAACMIIQDGVMPSGKHRGYILRRLLRRMLASSLALNIDISDVNYYQDLVNEVAKIYEGVYDIDANLNQTIVSIFINEATKYKKAISTGNKEWTKTLANSQLTAQELAHKSFDMYQSLGVPLELSEDILDNNKTPMDLDYLTQLIEGHQKLSTTTSQGQFKSGLASNTTKTTAMHTTTHILHQILRDCYGPDVRQMGSAITEDKARFDFSCNQDVNNDIPLITKLVNGVIERNLVMDQHQVSQDKAREMGAIGLFGEKYGATVTIYQLHDTIGNNYSTEFCGGPHVSNTSEIKDFQILKVKSLGQGVKRIEFDVA